VKAKVDRLYPPMPNSSAFFLASSPPTPRVSREHVSLLAPALRCRFESLDFLPQRGNLSFRRVCDPKRDEAEHKANDGKCFHV
jgi:hypothetical protein